MAKNHKEARISDYAGDGLQTTKASFHRQHISSPLVLDNKTYSLIEVITNDNRIFYEDEPVSYAILSSIEEGTFYVVKLREDQTYSYSSLLKIPFGFLRSSINEAKKFIESLKSKQETNTENIIEETTPTIKRGSYSSRKKYDVPEDFRIQCPRCQEFRVMKSRTAWISAFSRKILCKDCGRKGSVERRVLRMEKAGKAEVISQMKIKNLEYNQFSILDRRLKITYPLEVTKSLKKWTRQNNLPYMLIHLALNGRSFPGSRYVAVKK